MEDFLNPTPREQMAGGLMLALGSGAIVRGISYRVGELSKMGPGFLPVSFGAILVLIGILLILRAKRTAPGLVKAKLRSEWRGWLCIITGIGAFIVLGHYGGLVPATFILVFVSALGDRSNSIKGALFLALALVAVAIVVFWWALQVPFPFFQWG
jgi:hypothetical protein